jgi:hypothetical protein
MTKREQFIKYVKEGGHGKPICSPQIGGGAGFDTKLAGKEWISDTTLEDTLAAVERFDIVPLINLWLGDGGSCSPKLEWKEVSCKKEEDAVTHDYILGTLKGPLRRTAVEKKLAGWCQTKYPITEPHELNILEYYIEETLERDFSPLVQQIRDQVSKIAGQAAVCMQWSVQPYEMLCFPNGVDTVILAEDCPDQFRRIMEKIVFLDEKLMKATAAGGADFIFLGAPGSELISPRYYEEFIIPYSKRVTDIAHECGLLVYSHICSRIEPFLTMGYYNRMGIDLFETLSPPPVGNVASMKDVMEKVDPSICTRGNIGLDVLLNGTPEVVREKTVEILTATRGRKHIVAASDYLFYGISEQNVRAMVDAVNEFGQ